MRRTGLQILATAILQLFNTPVNAIPIFAGDILVADQSAGAVFRIDPNTGSQVAVATGLPVPVGVAVSPTGQIFVTATYSQSLLQIDPANGVVSEICGGCLKQDPGELTIPGNPRDLTIGLDGKVYVTSGRGITRIDTATGQADLLISGDFVGIGTRQSGDLVVTRNGLSAEIVDVALDTVQLSVIAQFSLPLGDAWGVAEIGADLFVTNPNGGAIWTIRSDGSRSPFSTGFPLDIATSPNGLVVTDWGAGLRVTQRATPRVLLVQPGSGFASEISTGGLLRFPTGVAISPVTIVPEPSLALFLGIGLAGLSALRYQPA